MLQAKNFMTKDVISVTPETNIYDAMNIMVTKKISGLPVVNADNDLVGVISEKDMLGLLVEGDIGADHKVGEQMTKKVKSFTPEDSVVEITECLINHLIRRVPIVEDGKLAGIISRRDIISLILKLRGKLENGQIRKEDI